eukprot:319301_1
MSTDLATASSQLSTTCSKTEQTLSKHLEEAREKDFRLSASINAVTKENRNLNARIVALASDKHGLVGKEISYRPHIHGLRMMVSKLESDRELVDKRAEALENALKTCKCGARKHPPLRHTLSLGFLRRMRTQNSRDFVRFLHGAPAPPPSNLLTASPTSNLLTSSSTVAAFSSMQKSFGNTFDNVELPLGSISASQCDGSSDLTDLGSISNDIGANQDILCSSMASLPSGLSNGLSSLAGRFGALGGIDTIQDGITNGVQDHSSSLLLNSDGLGINLGSNSSVFGDGTASIESTIGDISGLGKDIGGIGAGLAAIASSPSYLEAVQNSFGQNGMNSSQNGILSDQNGIAANNMSVNLTSSGLGTCQTDIQHSQNISGTSTSNIEVSHNNTQIDQVILNGIGAGVSSVGTDPSGRGKSLTSARMSIKPTVAPWVVDTDPSCDDIDMTLCPEANDITQSTMSIGIQDTTPSYQNNQSEINLSVDQNGPIQYQSEINLNQNGSTQYQSSSIPAQHGSIPAQHGYIPAQPGSIPAQPAPIPSPMDITPDNFKLNQNQADQLSNKPVYTPDQTNMQVDQSCNGQSPVGFSMTSDLVGNDMSSQFPAQNRLIQGNVLQNVILPTDQSLQQQIFMPQIPNGQVFDTTQTIPLVSQPSENQELTLEQVQSLQILEQQNRDLEKTLLELESQNQDLSVQPLWGNQSENVPILPNQTGDIPQIQPSDPAHEPTQYLGPTLSNHSVESAPSSELVEISIEEINRATVPNYVDIYTDSLMTSVSAEPITNGPVTSVSTEPIENTTQSVPVTSSVQDGPTVPDKRCTSGTRVLHPSEKRFPKDTPPSVTGFEDNDIVTGLTVPEEDLDLDTDSDGVVSAFLKS